MTDEMSLKDIETISKFLKDKGAWYHVIIPESYSIDDMMSMKSVLDNCDIEGTFLVTRTDIKIADITEHIEKYMMERSG